MDNPFEASRKVQADLRRKRADEAATERQRAHERNQAQAPIIAALKAQAIRRRDGLVSGLTSWRWQLAPYGYYLCLSDNSGDPLLVEVCCDAVELRADNGGRDPYKSQQIVRRTPVRIGIDRGKEQYGIELNQSPRGRAPQSYNLMSCEEVIRQTLEALGAQGETALSQSAEVTRITFMRRQEWIYEAPSVYEASPVWCWPRYRYRGYG